MLLTQTVLLVFLVQTICPTRFESSSKSPPPPKDHISREALRCYRNCVSKCPKSTINKSLGLNCFNPCIQSCTPTSSSKFDKHKKENLAAALETLPKNYCTNGIDTSKLNSKISLLEFAKGPCSPVILVPGVTASRLTIEIDCEVFRAKENPVFMLCGWTDCTKRTHEIWKSVPDTEYLLWVPTLMSPMSILSFTEKSNMCFAYLVKPHYDLDKSPENMFEPRQGIKIQFYGFTGNTSKDKYCGKSAIKDLLPSSYQTGESEQFNKVIMALERLGYVSGLSFQAIPYNYFLSHRMNEFLLSFRPSVMRLKDLTGKKIVVFSHSMGNLNVLYNLKFFEETEIQELFKNWVAVAPPFFGSPKSQKSLVAGNSDYITLGGYFGFKFEAFKWTVSNQMSIYELASVDPFTVYKGEAWLEEVKKRMRYEANPSEIPFSESGFSFLPPFQGICHESLKGSLSIRCGFNIYDTSEKDMIQLEDRIYKMSETQKLLEDFKFTYHSPILFKKLYNPRLTRMNPRIPVIIVFTNSIKTENYHRFDDNYTRDIKRGYYPKESETGYTWGDTTVPTWSSLLLGLKWAYEYDHRNDKDGISDAQPVKFVEFCSIGYTYKPIYNLTPFNKSYRITENAYHGLNCDCNFMDDKKDYQNCDHSKMLGDSNIIRLLFEVVNSNSVSSQDHLQKILEMDPVRIDEDLQKCKHLRGNIFDS